MHHIYDIGPCGRRPIIAARLGQVLARASSQSLLGPRGETDMNNNQEYRPSFNFKLSLVHNICTVNIERLCHPG